jgi:hypothetical protein
MFRHDFLSIIFTRRRRSNGSKAAARCATGFSMIDNGFRIVATDYTASGQLF